MATLNVQLFGALVIRQRDGEALELPTPRVQELFCYLVLQRGRPYPRELLIDLFWRQSAPAQARRNLRQSLWLLQRALAPERAGLPHNLVHASSTTVQINPAAELVSDVAAFEAAFAPVDGLPGEHMDEAQAAALQAAVALYRGALLEGWYHEWCLIERERLQTLYLAMLDKLMSFCEARQRFELGLGFGERALRCERSSERTHRQLMCLHYFAGNRAAALCQYERCALALHEELGVPPSARTSELYQQIRAGTLAHNSNHTAAALAPMSPSDEQIPGALRDIHSRLLQLTDVVAGLQQQIQQELKTVERTIEEWLR